MFQFSGFATVSPCLQHGRFPHSDINGLSVVCTYPLLFAAYHVLRRLREPRHPPYALNSLPTLLIYSPFAESLNQNYLQRRFVLMLPPTLALLFLARYYFLSSLFLSFLLLLVFPVLSMNFLYKYGHDQLILPDTNTQQS
jgi:hypothetical protein